jgi:hypothetical protein
MTMTGGISAGLTTQLHRAEIRDAESRRDVASRDEERAARRREDAQEDLDRAERRRVDRYA